MPDPKVITKPAGNLAPQPIDSSPEGVAGRRRHPTGLPNQKKRPETAAEKKKRLAPLQFKGLPRPPSKILDSLKIKRGVSRPEDIKGSLIGPPLNLRQTAGKPLSLLEPSKLFNSLSGKKN